MLIDEIVALAPRMLAAILVGYLLGSIPFAYFVARLKGVDIFATGSRRAGTANVFWHVGRYRGMLVFACDGVKGLIAVYVAWMLGAPEPAAVAAGLAAVAGHWKSVFTGFKGGDGMVVLVGVSLAYLNWYILVGIGVGIVSVLLFRRSPFRSSLGIALGFAAMLALNTLRGVDWAVMLSLTALAMVVVTHNVLTHADHRPETAQPSRKDEVLIEDAPAVLTEAAHLNEDAILNQVIAAEDGDGDAEPSARRP